MSRASSRNSLAVRNNLKETYGDKVAILSHFDTSLLEKPVDMFSNQEKSVFRREHATLMEACFRANVPTLKDVCIGYDEDTMVAILMVHLETLNEFIGTNNKMMPEQVMILAKTIVGEFFYLKISEVIYFFHKCKCGYYRFFNGIEPIVVLQYLREFIRTDRNEAIDAYDTRLREEKEKRDRETAIPYEEYKRRKENEIL